MRRALPRLDRQLERGAGASPGCLAEIPKHFQKWEPAACLCDFHIPGAPSKKPGEGVRIHVNCSLTAILVAALF
jgi:hypothetical protein